MMMITMGPASQSLQVATNPFSSMQDAGTVDFFSFMDGLFTPNLPGENEAGTCDAVLDANGNLLPQLGVLEKATENEQSAVLSEIKEPGEKQKADPNEMIAATQTQAPVLMEPEMTIGLTAPNATMAVTSDEQASGTETVTALSAATKKPANTQRATWLNPADSNDSKAVPTSFFSNDQKDAAKKLSAEAETGQTTSGRIQNQVEQTVRTEDFVQFLIQDREIHSTETLAKVSAFFNEVDAKRQDLFQQAVDITGDTVALTGKNPYASISSESEKQAAYSGTDDSNTNFAELKALSIKEKAVVETDSQPEESSFKKEALAEANVNIAPEKTQQAVKAEPAGKESSSVQHAVYIQVSDRVLSTVQENGTASFKMKLYPEGLGEVQVTLDCKDAKVSLQIVTDNSATQELLQGQADELKAALLTKNYEVGTLQITNKTDIDSMAGQSFSFFDRGFAQEKQYRQSGNPTVSSFSDEDSSGTEVSNKPRTYVLPGRISIWA